MRSLSRDRAGPLTPSAPAAVRASQAAALIHRQPRPPILKEVFPTYEAALANLPEKPTPVTLPTLKAPRHSPENMDAEASGTRLDPTHLPTEVATEDNGPLLQQIWARNQEGV